MSSSRARLYGVASIMGRYSSILREGDTIKEGIEGDPQDRRDTFRSAEVISVRRDENGDVSFEARYQDGEKEVRTFNNFDTDPEDCWELDPSSMEELRTRVDGSEPYRNAIETQTTPLFDETDEKYGDDRQNQQSGTNLRDQLSSEETPFQEDTSHEEGGTPDPPSNEEPAPPSPVRSEPDKHQEAMLEALMEKIRVLEGRVGELTRQSVSNDRDLLNVGSVVNELDAKVTKSSKIFARGLAYLANDLTLLQHKEEIEWAPQFLHNYKLRFENTDASRHDNDAFVTLQFRGDDGLPTKKKGKPHNNRQTEKTSFRFPSEIQYSSLMRET